ncbi:MAG: hypothetical protein A2V98_15770 [Planctomycetes bacterium RBG_16_64_12]|nr:MAG: hypothetical protein A2V98_15770 [Planctomycetes bacterium RBG_16_64_12]
MARWRWSIERLVLLAAAGLVLRTWCVEGLFVPFKVTSGSMAETLRGVHRVVVCVDCGHRFACGADLPSISGRAVCPNCGCAENGLAARPDVAGDRLLVDKSIFSFRPPRRWELVAFRHPLRPSEIHVKRLVGLPGESIQIRNGDVYVDGKIQRKKLHQQRALAVLVHDANCTPKADLGLPPRWQADGVATGWSSAGGRYTHPSVPGATSIDWLNYRHWRRVPGRPGQTLETPITNDRAYNQTRPPRAENIHPVGDVLLSFRLVKTWGDGELFVRASDGQEEFQARIEPVESLYQVDHNGKLLGACGRGRLPDWTGDLHLQVSLFDQQFVLAFDGRPAVVYPYKPKHPVPDPTSQPLAIGSRGLGVDVRDVRVSRDVYYTHPVGLRGRWGLDEPFRLGAGEYFVLGDNSPISDDSRSWPEGPTLAERLLVGKPLLVHFPSRRIDLGPWHFQVPDPARIRYIR